MIRHIEKAKGGLKTADKKNQKRKRDARQGLRATLSKQQQKQKIKMTQ